MKRQRKNNLTEQVIERSSRQLFLKRISEKLLLKIKGLQKSFIWNKITDISFRIKIWATEIFFLIWFGFKRCFKKESLKWLGNRCLIMISLIIFIIAFLNWQREHKLKSYYLEEYAPIYVWLDYDLYKKIRAATNKNEVPTNWMLAIYDAESEGNRYAVSESGAMGLGQLMPLHLSEKLKRHKEVLFDIDFNINLSVRVYKDCLVKYNYDLVRSLNAYERGNKRKDINVYYLSKIIKNIGVVKEYR